MVQWLLVWRLGLQRNSCSCLTGVSDIFIVRRVTLRGAVKGVGSIVGFLSEASVCLSEAGVRHSKAHVFEMIQNRENY